MDEKEIRRIIDELYCPSNIEDFNEILNKDFTDDENELIDAYIKWWHWELEHEPKEEMPKIIGMHFIQPKDKVDISKYEYKPNKED